MQNVCIAPSQAVHDHGDLRLALSRCSWPSPRAFARAGYANQGWFPRIARWHRSIECLIRAVLLRCWKGLHCLNAVWHVRFVHGRSHVNNGFAASAVMCAISQVRTSSERKLSLSATRPPFTVQIAFLYVFSLSHSLVFVSFLRLSDLSHRQEQGRSMPSTQAVEPSPGHSRDIDGSEKVRTFDKRTHRHKLFDRQRFVSVLWLRHAQMLNLVEVWALTSECSSPVRECSPPDRNWSVFSFKPLSISLFVCLGTPFEFVFTLDHEFFLRNDKYGQEMKLSSKSSTSAIASPHVKFVKGC